MHSQLIKHIHEFEKNILKRLKEQPESISDDEIRAMEELYDPSKWYGNYDD